MELNREFGAMLYHKFGILPHDKQKVSRIGKYSLHVRYIYFGLSTEATWTYVCSVVPVPVPPNQAGTYFSYILDDHNSRLEFIMNIDYHVN